MILMNLLIGSESIGSVTDCPCHQEGNNIHGQITNRWCVRSLSSVSAWFLPFIVRIQSRPPPLVYASYGSVLPSLRKRDSRQVPSMNMKMTRPNERMNKRERCESKKANKPSKESGGSFRPKQA